MKTKFLSLCILLVGQAWGQVRHPQLYLEMQCVEGATPVCPEGDLCHCNWVAGTVGKKLTVKIAEPIDVPAIQEKYLAHKKGDSCNPEIGGLNLGMECRYGNDSYETRWTCAQKSRIKLTAEDGKVYCHKPRVQP